jgi:hypothetical protein
MKQFDTIVRDLQGSMQDAPRQTLRGRILDNVANGAEIPPIRRRFAARPTLAIALVLLLFGGVTVAAYTLVDRSQRVRELWAAEHMSDSGYLSGVFPRVYFTEEMRDQQRRIAQMSLEYPLSPMQRQIMIYALQLDSIVQNDERDAMLREAFADGRVVTARFDDTPLMVWAGSAYEHNFRGHLPAGTDVLITFGGVPYTLVTGSEEGGKRVVRAWHYVEVLDGELTGHTGWIPNFLLKPNHYAELPVFSRNSIEVTHPERDIHLRVSKHMVREFGLPYNFVPLETLMEDIADTIYERFAFCISDLSGSMWFSEQSGRWSVSIKIGRVSGGTETFFMHVDAVTGQISQLTRSVGVG